MMQRLIRPVNWFISLLDFDSFDFKRTLIKKDRSRKIESPLKKLERASFVGGL